MGSARWAPGLDLGALQVHYFSNAEEWWRWKVRFWWWHQFAREQLHHVFGWVLQLQQQPQFQRFFPKFFLLLFFRRKWAWLLHFEGELAKRLVFISYKLRHRPDDVFFEVK